MTAIHAPATTRLDRIRAAIPASGFDGVLVSDPDNRYYVSGYLVDDHGPTESAGVVLVGPDDALILTSPNNTEWAGGEAPAFEVIGWTRPWEKRVAEQIARLGWERVGFEPGSLSYCSWSRLREHAQGFELKPMAGEIDRLRWVKSADELEIMQRAINITDQAFESVEGLLEPGISERQVVAHIQRLFLELGADDAAFPSAVASGPNGAKPHHRSGDRQIQEGEPVVIDMGARVAGYCADLTRTTWVGSIGPEAAAIYRVVSDAQAAAIATVGAGVPASKVDQAARDVVEQASHSDMIVHAVGHGLGIRVHDGPLVSIASDLPLQTGNVVTIEPGLYLAGQFGVRIEDVVLVEEEGRRVLSHARKADLSG